MLCIVWYMSVNDMVLGLGVLRDLLLCVCVWLRVVVREVVVFVVVWVVLVVFF